VFSGRGLCDELITPPEESYRLWCVVVCVLQNLWDEEALAHWGGGGLSLPKQTNILTETVLESPISFSVYMMRLQPGQNYERKELKVDRKNGFLCF
jgi:hypothetical protein